MGAWGSTVFESDAALDWVDHLDERQSVHFITRTLRAVVKARSGKVLEADTCAAALAAAETIAAGSGRPCRGLPEPVKEWIQANKFVPNAKQVRVARDAVERVRSDSELAELWKGDSAWSGGLRRLLKRLTEASQKPKPPPLKPRKQRTGQSSSPTTKGGVTLAAIRRIARSRRGGLAIVNGEPSFLGFEGAILKDLVAVTECAECESLKSLNISGNGVTDRGMQCVGRLRNLTELVFKAPKVTDAGIAHLRPLSKLERLEIDRAGIGDDALRYIAELGAVTVLWLMRVNITDKGLEHLLNMKKLKSLNILDTAVTANALTRIGQRLKCRVHSDCLP